MSAGTDLERSFVCVCFLLVCVCSVMCVVYVSICDPKTESGFFFSLSRECMPLLCILSSCACLAEHKDHRAE